MGGRNKKGREGEMRKANRETRKRREREGG